MADDHRPFGDEPPDDVDVDLERGEPAEQVVLARHVLVDRDPGAPGQLGDAVEGRAVVARLGERLQRRIG